MNYRQKHCTCNDYEMEKYYMNDRDDLYNNCTYPEDYDYDSFSNDDDCYEKHNHNRCKKQCNQYNEERKCNKCSHEKECIQNANKRRDCCFCGIFKIFRCK